MNYCQTREKQTEQNRRMSFVARHPAMTTDCRCDVGQVKRIDVLPDDTLLEIFDFYMNICPSYDVKPEVEAWQSLVHVCRRWRNVVFESPLRLNLQLRCTPGTLARNTLDVWPAFPLIIKGNMTLSGTDNVTAALEQSDRVREVNLTLTGRQLENVLAPMQVSFPIRSWMDLPHFYDS